VAVSVIRCCGRGWIGRSCMPSKDRVRGATTTAFGALSAICALVLALPVETARAADEPPVVPAVPVIAVQVSVSIPSVSVNVQVGAVSVSVTTAPVDVSVTTSTSGTVSSSEAAAAAQQTTPDDGSVDCCVPAAAEVPPADTVATTSRPTRASPPERPAPPPTRAAARSVRAQTIRTPRVDRPTRSPTAAKVSRRASKRPATRPKALRRCCEHAQPSAVAGTRRRADLPPGVRLALDRHTVAAARPAASPEEPATDNRLLLQLGVLAAFLYLVCLAAWYSATRPRRRRA
jgi:hypothetical protein